MTGNKTQRGEHKIFLLLLLFLGVIAALFFYTARKNIHPESSSIVIQKPAARRQTPNVDLVDGKIVRVKIGSTEIAALVAKSDAKKHTGLGGRNALGAGDGMLFVFDSFSKYSFWNKDMLFPIDIVWIKDNTAVDISENMPDFKTSPNYTVTPQAEANFVIEVNAGFIREHNIKINDKITIQ